MNSYSRLVLIPLISGVNPESQKIQLPLQEWNFFSLARRFDQDFQSPHPGILALGTHDPPEGILFAGRCQLLEKFPRGLVFLESSQGMLIQFSALFFGYSHRGRSILAGHESRESLFMHPPLFFQFFNTTNIHRTPVTFWTPRGKPYLVTLLIHRFPQTVNPSKT